MRSLDAACVLKVAGALLPRALCAPSPSSAATDSWSVGPGQADAVDTCSVGTLPVHLGHYCYQLRPDLYRIDALAASRCGSWR